MKLCEHFMTKLMMFCLLVGVVLLSGAPPVAAQNVNIPDAGLRKAINKPLGENRAADAAVTEAEIKTLTSLSAYGYRDAGGTMHQISDLTGLEKATNLTRLDLYGDFTDISALSGLTNLTYLNLSGSFTDISALSSLTNLTSLRLIPGLGWTRGISALSNLTNLTHLILDGWFTDISALSSLTNLTSLVLSRDIQTDDISPLVSNTGLGTGDMVELDDNSRLSYPSIYTHIPALKTRGVTVRNFTNRVPTTLTKVSGDAQTGTPGTALASPFVVEVKDGATTAKTFAGVPVTFAVTAGGGTLSATSVATDANGRAQVTLRPGTTAATQTVTATVTHAGRTLTQTFSTTVNFPPTFAATFSVAENTTAVGTVIATDANSEDNITGYTITGGADSSKFAITNAGVLTFVAAPDYEAPGDLVSTDPANAAGNNEYIIVVTATSGSGARQATAAQTLTITVTDVNEAAEDVDSDGDVDIDDLVSVISNFGSASPGDNDIDSDGDVDAADIRAVFAALVAATAGAPAHLTHTAKTLQDYVQQVEQRGMLDANFQQGLAVLEALLEPFLLPDETALLRNYPNPFNPETWLPYQLAKSSDVTFSIYSVNGTLVRTLSLGYQAAGVYRHRSRAAYWDGRNALGEPVASGVYFYTLTAGDFIATGKMLIRK